MALPRRTRAALTTTAKSAAALPASLALVVAAGGALSTTAQAAAPPGPELRILSPRKSEGQRAAGTFSIDVSFRGRTATQGVVAAEVWVNGVRWMRRELAGQLRGVLTLDLDGSTLPAGRHEVLVKLFGADATTSSKTITIETGGAPAEAASSGAEIAFRAPAQGARVSGVVDVNLDVAGKNGSGGSNPYVTFYVDKEFKTLKNYPPYSFSWDTTNVANGLHTIEATAFLDSNSAPATRRLQLFVDNAGGNTVRQPDIPDLRAPRAPAPPVPVTAASTAVPLVIPTTAKPRTRPLAGTAGRVSRPTPAPPRFAPPAGATAHTFVTPAASALVAAPTPPPAVSSEGPDLRMRVRPEARGVRRVAGTSVARPAGPEARFVVPSGAGPSLAPAPGVVTPGPRAAGLDWAAGTIAGLERGTLSLAGPRAISGNPSARGAARVALPATTRAAASAAPVAKPAVRQTQRVTPQSPRRVLAAGPIQVAFNGQQIAFDVAPRVEAGLPLAPFRQIFEHTGGRVTWVSQTRVVRAVNSEREIVITLGKSAARVNDQTISLARPAFLEQGRTIVPLGFVGKALDVNVQYDSATGRLQITSKKK